MDPYHILRSCILQLPCPLQPLLSWMLYMSSLKDYLGGNKSKIVFPHHGGLIQGFHQGLPVKEKQDSTTYTLLLGQKDEIGLHLKSGQDGGNCSSSHTQCTHGKIPARNLQQMYYISPKPATTSLFKYARGRVISPEQIL